MIVNDSHIFLWGDTLLIQQGDSSICKSTSDPRRLQFKEFFVSLQKLQINEVLVKQKTALIQ